MGGHSDAIIHKYSDFVSFPIYLGDETKAINRQQAIWRLPASEVTDEAANEYYKQLTYDFTDPMTRIQVNTDVPVQIRALLFIPAKLDRGLFSVKQDFGLRLYSHQIRIQDHYKELLPNYLRFIEGVVDSDDIPLNVSRESVQSSPFMARIKKVLTGRVLGALAKMADKEPEQYDAFWREFGAFIKEGVINEYGDQEKLTPLLRFHSSKGDDRLVSFNDYIGRVDPAQKTIYYIVGDDLSTLRRSPHLDAFHAQDIEVLYFTDPLDGFLPSSLREYEGFNFQNVADAGLELPKQDDEEAKSDQDAMPEAEWAALVERFKTQLGDKIVDVRRSDLLVEHPARLVAPAGSPGSEMDRVRRLMDEHYEIPKKILELNPRHPIVTNLASLISTGDQDELVNVSIEQIYENGLLLEGLHPNPADMVEHIQ
ncbi:MAG TPA: molecular chaperone HtpG, partial [Caldilineae bacterium]|nr:molecular chaperone HtpG [Caldilineae bacterium]